ncbi:MAG: histidinol-phosphate transaminase [Isosphaeraceae bacterium]
MKSYFLPHVDRMTGYQPGEQPRGGVIIKLNTNENPYPPSPRAIEAIRAAADERLRRYPDPLGTSFREAVARYHGRGVTPEHVLAGNGSDDLLTILTRAFVGPGQALVSPTPSYILYRTLAEIQDARIVEVPFRPDWSIEPGSLRVAGARLVFLANPNSPSGTTLAPADVAEIARDLDCPLVVDEAYANFAETDCVALVNELPNVIVTRSFSKGFSLAGMRLGYLIAQPEIIEGLVKVKDSYNCDTLSLAGGAAALDDTAYLHETRARILSTRARLTTAVREMGFKVPTSHANFVWCTGHPRSTEIYQALKEQGILVRLMRYADHAPGIRITVGTDAEIDRLLTELARLV